MYYKQDDINQSRRNRNVQSNTYKRNAKIVKYVIPQKHMMPKWFNGHWKEKLSDQTGPQHEK